MKWAIVGLAFAMLLGCSGNSKPSALVPAKQSSASPTDPPADSPDGIRMNRVRARIAAIDRVPAQPLRLETASELERSQTLLRTVSTESDVGLELGLDIVFPPFQGVANDDLQYRFWDHLTTHSAHNDGLVKTVVKWAEAAQPGDVGACVGTHSVTQNRHVALARMGADRAITVEIEWLGNGNWEMCKPVKEYIGEAFVYCPYGTQLYGRNLYTPEERRFIAAQLPELRGFEIWHEVDKFMEYDSAGNRTVMPCKLVDQTISQSIFLVGEGKSARIERFRKVNDDTLARKVKKELGNSYWQLYFHVAK